MVDRCLPHLSLPRAQHPQRHERPHPETTRNTAWTGDGRRTGKLTPDPQTFSGQPRQVGPDGGLFR
jgi:hypothetical protein